MCQRSKSQYMLLFFFNVVRLMWSDWFLKMSLLLYCYLLLPVEDVNLHEVNVTRIPSFFFFLEKVGSFSFHNFFFFFSVFEGFGIEIYVQSNLKVLILTTLTRCYLIWTVITAGDWLIDDCVRAPHHKWSIASWIPILPSRFLDKSTLYQCARFYYYVMPFNIVRL